MLKYCREDEGKMAWAIYRSLLSADRIDCVIADDELAVLIICVRSSQNLLIKHHFVHPGEYKI